MSLHIESDEGKITASGHDILLETKTDSQTADILRTRFSSFLQGDVQNSAILPISERCMQLGNDLVNLSLGDKERELFSRGYKTKTRGLSRDDSPWFWFARQFYLQTGLQSFVMQAADDQSTSFVISTGNEQIISENTRKKDWTGWFSC
ncbi:MAG: hypothetical protein U9R69_05760 [Thermodesulfobacteriota bacterium]|nr:hypothetical protein [Thermodesulfobacteriota bacterium]